MSKSTIDRIGTTATWLVRCPSHDSIGTVKINLDTGMFYPARLGVHGPACASLRKAVLWVEAREKKQGIDTP